MKEEDKKTLDEMHKTYGEKLQDLMKNASNQEKLWINETLSLFQIKTLHYMILAIKTALVKKGIITEEELDEELKNAVKETKEQQDFIEKLMKGA